MKAREKIQAGKLLTTATVSIVFNFSPAVTTDRDLGDFGVEVAVGGGMGES